MKKNGRSADGISPPVKKCLAEGVVDFGHDETHSTVDTLAKVERHRIEDVVRETDDQIAAIIGSR